MKPAWTLSVLAGSHTNTLATDVQPVLRLRRHPRQAVGARVHAVGLAARITEGERARAPVPLRVMGGVERRHRHINRTGAARGRHDPARQNRGEFRNPA